MNLLSILTFGINIIADHELTPEMAVENDTPDPDRGEDDILDTSETRTPPIIIQGDSDEEEEEEEEGGQGYTILAQGEDEVDEGEMTREQELAALVRAAQADQENLSGGTQEMISQARFPLCSR